MPKVEIGTGYTTITSGEAERSLVHTMAVTEGDEMSLTQAHTVDSSAYVHAWLYPANQSIRGVTAGTPPK